MAKLTKPAPKAPEAPETEGVKAPDMAPLIASISGLIADIKGADETKDNANIDIAVAIREFREENPEVERSAVRLALQTAIADTYGLKIEHVQSKPEETLKKSKPADYANRASAYVLVSTLLSIAWAKDEKQDAKVAKLLDGGERRFVVLKKAASKPQANPQRDPDANKITLENLPQKLALFVTQAMADTGASADDIYARCHKALDAMEEAPAE